MQMLRCDVAREAISARMDGELLGVGPADLDAHLRTCAGCAAFAAQAPLVTRAARVRPAEEGIRDRADELASLLLAEGAVPAARTNWSSGRQLIRLCLAASGLALVAVGLLMLVSTGLHTGRELGAFEVALGVGFLASALRPAGAAALLPVGAVLVLLLLTGSTADIASGLAGTGAEVGAHGPEVFGVGLLLALALQRGPDERRRRRVPDLHRGGLAVVVLLAATVLSTAVGARPALAHAVLTSTTPVDGDVVEIAPEAVSLRFNEPIHAATGGLRVYDSRGDQVAAGTGDRPEPEEISLPVDGLEEGTYVVTYRVTSADGHPIAGAFVFSVGREGAASDDLVRALLNSSGDRPYAVAATVVRWVLLVSVLAAAGLALAAAWLRKQAGDDLARLAKPLRLASLVALAGTLLGVPLQAVLVNGGGAGTLVRGSALAEVLGSPYGWSAAMRLGGAVLLLATGRRLLASRGAGQLAALAGAVALAGSLLLEGHTLTSNPRWLVVLADALHVAAGAAWLGGLVGLAVLMRRRRREGDPVGAARLVARFSSLAMVAVGGVVVAGATLGWVEVRALRALTSTTYGWTLVAKLVLVAPVLWLGWINNRKLVPAIVQVAGGSGTQAPAEASPGPKASTATGATAAWQRLRRAVRAEVALLTAVLAVTAVLVNLEPAASEAGIGGIFSTTVPLGDLGQVTFTVDPNFVGSNQVHLYLLGQSGRPEDLAESVTLELEQPALDIGPIVREPDPAGPGHYVLTGPELSVPGEWELTIQARQDRFSVVEETVSFSVNG